MREIVAIIVTLDDPTATNANLGLSDRSQYPGNRIASSSYRSKSGGCVLEDLFGVNQAVKAEETPVSHRLNRFLQLLKRERLPASATNLCKTHQPASRNLRLRVLKGIPEVLTLRTAVWVRVDMLWLDRILQAVDYDALLTHFEFRSFVLYDAGLKARLVMSVAWFADRIPSDRDSLA